MVSSKRSGGFTLIEIVFTAMLVAVVVSLSLWALRPGVSKAPAQGLAAALAGELEAARQLAIASGHPVALGIPTNEGGTSVAASVYRLQGWNRPVVTYSRDYSGDFPDTVFLAAKWPGPSFTEGAPEGDDLLSKFTGFELENWIPSEFQKDYIFCFQANGELALSSQPAMEGRYTLVVARNPVVGGSPPNQCVISNASAASTLFISPTGGVEVLGGLPGGPALGAGSTNTPTISSPQPRVSHGGGGATVKLSEIRVLPKPTQDPILGHDRGLCVPGQVMTLELYAYDPAGRALFSKWNQTSEGALGQFSYPFSDENINLVGEVDKMEFVYEWPDEGENKVVWPGGDPPPGVGVFRARWNWTVPITSEPGQRYRVQADVRDAKGEVSIQHPPEEVFAVAPAGRLLVERRDDDGVWQLVLMNPDGSAEQILSPPGVEEVMPSLDRAATKMAFLQGTLPNRYVKIRSVHGGPELTIAGPGSYTSVSLSPDGAWISFREQNLPSFNGTLITRRVDRDPTQPPEYSDPQPFMAGTHKIKKSRTGWSQDSRYMLYERDNTIHSRNLATGNSVALAPGFNNDAAVYSGPETPYAPVSYFGGASGAERVMISLGNNNPVLISFEVTQQNYESGGVAPPTLSDFLEQPTGQFLAVGYGGNAQGSAGSDNDYPSISSNGQELVFTRSAQSSSAGGTLGPDGMVEVVEDLEDQHLWIVPQVGDNFIMPEAGVSPVTTENVRRGIWIPTVEGD